MDGQTLIPLTYLMVRKVLAEEFSRESNGQRAVLDGRFSPSCDGCGRKFVVGETIVSGIESCCGGCKRELCSNCILAAAKVIEQLAPGGVAGGA